MLEHVAQAMLAARETLRAEMTALNRRARAHAREDATCRLLMTAPGVGVLTALTFKSAVDDPGRFRSSKMVGAHFGLTPSKHQSGEKDVTGAITRAGDGMARSTLYEAATALLTRTKAFSSLKNWGLAVASTRAQARDHRRRAEAGGQRENQRERRARGFDAGKKVKGRKRTFSSAWSCMPPASRIVTARRRC